MKTYTLYDKRVALLLTEVSDGNMKVTPELTPEQQAAARHNRQQAIHILGLDNTTTALLRVTYNKDDFCQFLTLSTAERASLEHDFSAEYSDGILTNSPGLGLFLPLADCLGLVLYDKSKHLLMMAHCGRHTLLQQGALRAVQYMTEQAGADPKNVYAWTSPCAGQENYPVFEADNKGLQDLALEQLIRAGVPAEHITRSPVDTTTSPDYFSHSQGDAQSRFAICAKLL